MNQKSQFLRVCMGIDTETTSINPKEAEVIELGYVVSDGEAFLPFNELFRPNGPIEPKISKVTNITYKMVANARQFDESVPELTALVDAYDGDAILVAHNVPYDRTVLEQYDFHHYRWLCTLRMARKLFADDQSVEEHTLGYLRYRFEILDPADNPDIDMHRAGSDALVALHFLSYMLDVMEERGLIDPNEPYGPQVFDWIDAPMEITSMPFGKHKGKPLAEVPMSYWNWALANMDTLDEKHDDYDEDFATAVAKALTTIMEGM